MTKRNEKRTNRIMRLAEDKMSHGRIAIRLFEEGFDSHLEEPVSRQAIRQLIVREKERKS